MVSSANKTDRLESDITEILLKVTLNIIYNKIFLLFDLKEKVIPVVPDDLYDIGLQWGTHKPLKKLVS